MTPLVWIVPSSSSTSSGELFIRTQTRSPTGHAVDARDRFNDRLALGRGDVHDRAVLQVASRPDAAVAVGATNARSEAVGAVPW
jgi:hypothetical protein